MDDSETPEQGSLWPLALKNSELQDNPQNQGPADDQAVGAPENNDPDLEFRHRGKIPSWPPSWRLGASNPETHLPPFTQSMNAFLSDLDGILEEVKGSIGATEEGSCEQQVDDETGALTRLATVGTRIPELPADDLCQVPPATVVPVAAVIECSSDRPHAAVSKPTAKQSAHFFAWLRKWRLGAAAGVLVIAGILGVLVVPKSVSPLLRHFHSPNAGLPEAQLSAATSSQKNERNRAPLAAGKLAVRPAKPVLVSGAVHSSNGSSTTIEVALDGRANFVANRLQKPDRIYFDLSNSWLSPDLPRRHFVLGETFVRKLRIDQRSPGLVRIALETVGVCDYTATLLSDPYRLHIRIRGYAPLPHPPPALN
jgi:AMIN domain-containing protein